MKAILVNVDRSLRWDDVENPILGNDDCLVKIEAAALNRADLMQREGDYPLFTFHPRRSRKYGTAASVVYGIVYWVTTLF